MSKHLHSFKPGYDVDFNEYCRGEGCSFQMKHIREVCIEYNKKHGGVKPYSNTEIYE